MLQGDITKKAEHNAGVMGYTMVWPSLKVKLEYVSSFFIFAGVMMDDELPQDVVRVSHFLEVHHMYVTVKLVLFQLGPISSALVLNEQEMYVHTDTQFSYVSCPDPARHKETVWRH